MKMRQLGIRCFFILAASALTGGSADAQEKYKTDQGHTEVFFEWSHVGVSVQQGEFTKVDGTLMLVPDNPEASSLSVVVDVTSLSSGYAKLDENLKSKKFLDVSRYPEATFQSTSIEMTGKKTAKITGDFTLHGVTRPVVLDTTLTHRGMHPTAAYIPSYKGEWVAFHATTTLNHQAFGVGAYSTGPITITIRTEMKRE